MLIQSLLNGQSLNQAMVSGREFYAQHPTIGWFIEGVINAASIKETITPAPEPTRALPAAADSHGGSSRDCGSVDVWDQDDESQYAVEG